MDKYYKILEIPNDSSKDAISKAYKKLAIKWHPDKNINNKEVAEEKFKHIAEAYEILMDDDKRNKINFNNFNRNPMSNNFRDPFEIFNKIFKDQNFNNVNSFDSFNNFTNIHRANNIFSFNTSKNNPNIFSRSESIKTSFINGKKRIERTTQINNGNKSIIIEEDGIIISKQNFDQNGKLIEN